MSDHPKTLKCSLCGGLFNRLIKDGMYRDQNDKPVHYKYEGDGACGDCHRLAHPNVPSLYEIHERMKREQKNK